MLFILNLLSTDQHIFSCWFLLRRIIVRFERCQTKFQGSKRGREAEEMATRGFVPAHRLLTVFLKTYQSIGPFLTRHFRRHAWRSGDALATKIRYTLAATWVVRRGGEFAALGVFLNRWFLHYDSGTLASGSQLFQISKSIMSSFCQSIEHVFL